MEVVVFGAGSLGSLVGGLLARDHDVTLVGRDPHVAAVRENGLQITGLESFVTHPTATTEGENLEAELAIVTVKAFDTPTAAAALSSGKLDCVLSLQNGMGNEDVLADELDVPVLAGTTSHGAILTNPGLVEWTGRGEVVFGGWRPAETPLVDRIARAFEAAELSPRVVEDMTRELWLKLVVNTAINPVTALAGLPNRGVLEGDAAAVTRDAATETAATARAEGIDLRDDLALERLEAVVAATAENRSSMYGDVAAERRTEVDQLNGYVVDRAGAHGLEVPINRTLTALIRAWEDARGLR